jgi:hypothetical protein
MPIMSDPHDTDGEGSEATWKAGWTCPLCHEDVPEWFDNCWNCEGTKPLRTAFELDRIVEIDGLLFSNLAEFCDHFQERTGLAPCCGNLDIFSEILDPKYEFGAPLGGFTIRWRNHRVSMERLGTLFNEIVDIIRDHGPGGSQAHALVRLDLL